MSLLQRFKPKSSGDKSNQRNSVSAPSENRSDNIAEGFLCPECRVVFNDPEALQKHFLQAHSTESTSASQSSNIEKARFACPQCLSEFKSDTELKSHFNALHDLSEHKDGDVSSLRLELNDLRASLKEEKWYSEELKKEMDKLQSKIQENFRPVGDGDEINLYLQQIQVLEAGKALVTSKMLETDKLLSEAQRTNESVQRERNRFLEKSTNLSQELASAMSQLDELSGHKIALTENLTKLQEKIVDLEAQLDARPSEDDVSVLRKELIHAQTLMDQISKESENEATQWQIKSSQLESKCSEYEEIVKGLTQKMEQEDFYKLKQETDSLEFNLSTVLEEKGDLLKDVEKYKTLYNDMEINFEKVNEINTMLNMEKETIEKKVSALEKTLKDANEKDAKESKFIQELSEKYETLKATYDNEKSLSQHGFQEKLSELDSKQKMIQEMVVKNQQLEVQLSNVNIALQELNEKRVQTDSLVLSLEEQNVIKERKFNETQSNLEKYRQENEKLNERVEDLNSENERKENSLDNMKATSRRLETKLDELNHEIEKKCSKQNELENLISRLTEEKESVLKEKRELFEKMQAGEEGVTTVLQQVTSEKVNLEQRISHLETELMEERKKNETNCDQFQQTMRETKEKLKEEQDNCAKLKASLATGEEKLISLNSVIGNLNADLETKNNTISTLERDGNAFKRDFETKLTHSNETQTKTSKEIERLNSELKKRNETITELQTLVDDLSMKFQEELKVSTELNKKLDILETNLNGKIQEAEKWLNNFKEAEIKAKEDGEKLITLQGNFQELQSQYGTVVGVKEKLLSELNTKGQEIETLKQCCEKLKEEKLNMENSLQNMHMQSAKSSEELKKEIANLESALKHSTDDSNRLQNEVKNLLNAKDEVSKKHNELASQLKDRDLVYSRQSEEAALTSKKSQQIVEELKTECLILKKRLDENIQNSQRESAELTLLVSGLETTVNDLKKQIKDGELREEELKTVLLIKTNESEEFIKQADLQIKSSEQEISTLQSTVEELKSTNRDLENNYKNSVSDIDRIKGDRDSLKNRLDSLQNSSSEEISVKEKQLKSSLSEITELKREIETFNSSVTNLTSKLKEVEENRNLLENERKNLHKDLEQRNMSYADLDATKIQLENLLKDLRNESESELANQKAKTQRAETERNELVAKCRQLEDHQADLEERLSSCQNEMKLYVETNESTKATLENECKNLKSQLTDLQNEKHQSAKEFSIKLASLENTQQNLEENFTKCQTEYDQLRIELETTKKELKVTSSAKQDLDAQLGAWSEEKRMLLERCLMFEKEVDEEKDNGRELKRRLDDAISAMHELGRENQSLQIDMSKHVNRKWADDNEAFNCNSCGKQFSVTVRKHHCRHCGMIFCNECSSKSCLVALAKKPVRVCDNCYVELNGRQ